jgi:hypothetical protein
LRSAAVDRDFTPLRYPQAIPADRAAEVTSSGRSDPNASNPNGLASDCDARPNRILGGTNSIGGAVPSSTRVALARGSGAACTETAARTIMLASVAIVMRISASKGKEGGSLRRDR